MQAGTPDIGWLSTAELFRALEPATAAALLAEADEVALTAGAVVFREGESSFATYVVRHGRLEAFETEPDGTEDVVRVIGPGEVVDELQALSGSERPVTVRAAEQTAALRIPSIALDRLVRWFPDLDAARERFHRRQLLCRLHPVFGTFDRAFTDEVEEMADWIHLPRGASLTDVGVVDAGVFLVISGRVSVTAQEEDGSTHDLGEAGRGETIGEFTFFGPGTESVAVQAIRDSVLVGFTEAEFDRIVSHRPAILRQITRHLLERQRRPARSSEARVTNIAVVRASPGAPLDRFCERMVEALTAFGPTVRLSAEAVDRAMDERGIAQAAESSTEATRLLAWLEDLESAHRFVVYEADASATAWSRRCIGQADRVLLVARAADEPSRLALEEALLLKDGEEDLGTHEVLVLTHPDGSSLPTGTRRWLDARPYVEEHIHLRWDGDADFARLARTLAGRALGLVLGGGGARGFAHIGVLKALEEAGVHVDAIGGTSMGAALAAQYAMGWSPEKIEEVNHRVWVEIRPHKRYTVPVLSLVGSGKAEMCGRMMYGETDIEDLWIPFFCVSSNLTTADMMIHRRGSLLRAATASASIPAFAVPVLEGKNLLVDGALLNNIPSDVMRELGCGTVVACQVSVEDDARFVCDHIPTPWEVVRGRFSRLAPPPRFPSLVEVAMRATMLYSTRRERAAIEEADFCLRPPIQDFSLMDFSRIHDIVRTGYEYARGEIEAWGANEGAPAVVTV